MRLHGHAIDTCILLIETDDGDVQEVKLPTRMEVCDRCEGRGRHTNPNIDGNGLPEEFVEDPEFMEDYLAGVYDVSCEVCHGRNVIEVPDLDRMTPEQIRLWTQQCQDEFDYQRECEMERRMGA